MFEGHVNKLSQRHKTVILTLNLMKNIPDSILSISVFLGLTNRWKEDPILFKDIHAKVENL